MQTAGIFSARDKTHVKFHEQYFTYMVFPNYKKYVSKQNLVYNKKNCNIF